jgi:hypothetical protein
MPGAQRKIISSRRSQPTRLWASELQTTVLHFRKLWEWAISVGQATAHCTWDSHSRMKLTLRTILPKLAVTSHCLIRRISGVSTSRPQADATHRETVSRVMCSLGQAGCSFVIALSPEPLLRVEVDVLDPQTNLLWL